MSCRGLGGGGGGGVGVCGDNNLTTLGLTLHPVRINDVNSFLLHNAVLALAT